MENNLQIIHLNAEHVSALDMMNRNSRNCEAYIIFQKHDFICEQTLITE